MDDGAKLSKLNGGNRPKIAFGISVLLHLEYILVLLNKLLSVGISHK